MPREWAPSRPTRIYKPLKQIEPLALSLDRNQNHRTRCRRPPNAQTLRPVLQRKPHVNLLNYARWSPTVKNEPLDMRVQCTPVTYAERSAKHTSTGLTPERPVPYLERFAKHGVTGLATPDSLRASGALSQPHYWSHATPDAHIGSSPHPVQSVWCSTLTVLGTDSTPDAQAQRPVPPRQASDECHSRNFSKLSTGALENIHLIFSKNVESRRGTQTPLYPSTSTSFLKCANRTKCVSTCARVLAFSQSFSLKGLS